MRWFFRSDFRSFYFLNATQFLGALNDNIFKLLVIYLFIHIKGPAAANTILALAGAIFVIPFLLFSSGAGVLADRISKRTIIVFAKSLELAVTVLGFFAVSQEWELGSYAALFLMATHSAIFGPSKYGIIPELVEEKMVSKANGSITSFTYLAIILGTFLATFITDITNKNFAFESLFCVFIASIGLLMSFGIKWTAPQKSTKKINPFFLYEIYQTLKIGWKVPHLLPVLFGSAFFLFLGAFTQLNIIPFAMQSLHLSEVGGGYLFLSTAVGIAIGAVLAGQLSKDRVEPGISCLAGFFIALFFFLLSVFSWSLPATILILALLGVVGGGFLVPFDSYLQVNSPDEKRGQIIAAASFFSFVGVLLAALCLYLFSEKWGLSASSSFSLMGGLTLFANLILSGRLSALLLPFFVQKILKRFRKLILASPLPDPSQVVVLQSNSWWDALLLFRCLPRLKILLPEPYFRHFPWINGLVDSFRIIPPKSDPRFTIEEIFQQAKELQAQNNFVCIFFHRQKCPDISRKSLEKYAVVYAHGKKERIAKRFFLFHPRQVTLIFSKD